MDDKNFSLPATYQYIISSFLSNQPSTILDLGCGEGIFGRIFNQEKKYKVTGVDIFAKYLHQAKKSQTYAKLIKSDLQKFSAKKDSYQVVVCLQVIEHLPKKQSLSLIKKILVIASKTVIITTPNGDCLQHELDDNPYQKHLSVWEPGDLRKLGFKVYGQGLKFVYGKESYGAGKGMNWWQKLALVASTLLTPVVYFYPEWAAQMIAVKQYDEKN